MSYLRSIAQRASVTGPLGLHPTVRSPSPIAEFDQRLQQPEIAAALGAPRLTGLVSTRVDELLAADTQFEQASTDRDAQPLTNVEQTQNPAFAPSRYEPNNTLRKNIAEGPVRATESLAGILPFAPQLAGRTNVNVANPDSPEFGRGPTTDARLLRGERALSAEGAQSSSSSPLRTSTNTTQNAQAGDKALTLAHLPGLESNRLRAEQTKSEASPLSSKMDAVIPQTSAPSSLADALAALETWMRAPSTQANAEHNAARPLEPARAESRATATHERLAPAPHSPNFAPLPAPASTPKLVIGQVHIEITRKTPAVPPAPQVTNSNARERRNPLPQAHASQPKQFGVYAKETFGTRQR